MFYAMIYGDKSSDVEYYVSLQKACEKLIIQTVAFVHGETSFHPMIIEYHKCSDDYDMYGRTKYTMCVREENLMQLKRFDISQVKANPLIAIDYIEPLC